MQHFAEEIVRRLVEAQVEFVVVGGFSAVLQGVPIVTHDLDICYRRTPSEGIIGQTSTVTFAGHAVKILSLAQLIATKRAANRPQDHLSLPYLETAYQRQQQEQPPPADDPPPTS